VAADDYDLIEGPQTVEEYRRLRVGAGLTPKSEAQAAGAVAGGWYAVHVRHRGTGEAVGMGRVIGDGGWYFHLADMAVLPDHQRQGLGRRVLDRLVEEIRTRAPEQPWITLLADPPGRPLYEQAGFRDTAPGSTGMALPLDPA
jgi:GNAT superfamily N-acetyltransferase